MSVHSSEMDITQMTANMSDDNESRFSSDEFRRTEYISWGDYFMGLALLTAQRSKDARLQVGACIVNDDNKIISLGYNEMPMERDDNHRTEKTDDNSIPWNKKTTAFICHAELNAIVRTTASDLKGCTIYVTQHPCIECARLIIQSGIKKILYLHDKTPEKEKYIECKVMLERLAFDIKKYKPKSKSINIKFED